MKKNFVTGVISGLMVGALIFGGGSTLAAAVKSIVGAKVTGVYSVEQNGKKIAEAPVINGSTYAPVRAIAEATGTQLTVTGKTIILEVSENMASIPLEGDVLSTGELELTNQIQKLKREILTNQQFISSENETIKMYEEKIAAEKAKAEPNQSGIDAISRNLAASRSTVADYEAKITEAEVEIARLQALIDADK